MAFGNKAKEITNTNTGNTGENQQVFESPFVDRHGGVRIMRVLPAIGEDSSILDESVTEVFWREVWWDGLKDGKETKVRVFLDYKNPFADPLWNYIAKNFEKGSPERRGFKNRFAVNVLDKTPVLIDENGQIVYANLEGKYVQLPNTSKTLPKPLTGEPKPLNKIRIWEGSTGAPGGKHDYQNLYDLATSIEGPDGNPVGIHQVDIKYKIQGSGIETKRTPFITANFSPLHPVYALMPRYNIESWVKPWPHDALEDLLEGRDLNEIFEEYRIEPYPKLVSFATDEVTPDYTNPETYAFIEESSASKKTQKRRKSAGFEE